MTDESYSPMGYLSINVLGRNNVRERLNPPEMRLVSGKGGRIVRVRLNEAQLLAIIRHATDALETLRVRRGATEPTAGAEGTGSDGAH